MQNLFSSGVGEGKGTVVLVEKYNSITLWAYLHLLQVSVSNIKTL